MSDLIFVYGTLLSDIPSSMSKFLRRRAELVGKAKVAGRLYDLGGYPGFASGGGTVKGEVYLLDPKRAEQTWEMLDAYEGVTGAPGEQYRRVEITVKIKGEKCAAQTYELRKIDRNLKVIPNGDYPPFYANNPEHRKFTGDS